MSVETGRSSLSRDWKASGEFSRANPLHSVAPGCTMESTYLSIGEKEGWAMTPHGRGGGAPCFASLQLAFYNSLLQFLTVSWPTNKSRGHNRESVQRNREAENASGNQVLPAKPKFQSSDYLLRPAGPWWEGKSLLGCWRFPTCQMPLSGRG